jgi:transposase
VQTWYARLVHLLNQHRLRKDEAGTLAHTLDRALRFAVLWRKVSQGPYNAKGDRWVERIPSLRETCRLGGIPRFPTLVEAVHCDVNSRHPDVSWL